MVFRCKASRHRAVPIGQAVSRRTNGRVDRALPSGAPGARDGEPQRQRPQHLFHCDTPALLLYPSAFLFMEDITVTSLAAARHR